MSFGQSKKAAIGAAYVCAVVMNAAYTGLYETDPVKAGATSILAILLEFP